MFGIGFPELIVIAVLFGVVAAAIMIIVLIISRGEKGKMRTNGLIYCTVCGKENDTKNTHCIRCGNVLRRFQPDDVVRPVEKPVPTYLVPAILVTIFCCLPFGIPAIVFAAQANGKLAAGDRAGAVESSNKAKMWCWIGFSVGLAFMVIYFLFIIMGIFSARR